MVKYTDKHGNAFVLRFDLNVMAIMTEKYGGYKEGIQKLMNSGIGDYETVMEIFGIMAQAGEDFLAERVEMRPKARISADGILDKYSSPGKVKVVIAAIFEAVKDGNETQLADEEDDQVRDGYLKELKELEAEKN